MWHTSSITKSGKEKDTRCVPLEILDEELMTNYKNIKIYEETHARLRSHGNMGESFDDLINRILDDWEKEQGKGAE